MTARVTYGGLAYAAGIDRFPDGRLAEIFPTATLKSGAIIEAGARDARADAGRTLTEVAAKLPGPKEPLATVTDIFTELPDRERTRPARITSPRDH